MTKPKDQESIQQPFMDLWVKEHQTAGHNTSTLRSDTELSKAVRLVSERVCHRVTVWKFLSAESWQMLGVSATEN